VTMDANIEIPGLEGNERAARHDRHARTADFIERVRVNQKKLTAELKTRYDFIVCGSGSSALIGVSAPKRIVQSVLTALNEGKISEAVDQFDDHFTFNDHALDLEFTDKGRLIEFFQKSRELFPDTVVEVDSTFQCGDHAVAEWKLTATQTVPYYGCTHFRIPISLRGTSIVHTKNGRITRWSDYYDQNRSWRFSLAAVFKEWIEY
jgi:steroid delta-isomerase-like uncharacterized protein